MDFEVKGVKYRAAKMDAFSQFHVARKLAPVFTAMGGLSDLAVMARVGGGEKAEEAFTAGAASLVSRLASVIAELSDEDTEAVLIRCLSVVSRVTETSAGAATSPVWNASAKRFQYADIGMAEMVQIAVHVIQDSLADFTSALP